ncbi:MAG: hypothetical protein JWL90_4275 [Chthoniobacteraceae bacterium]|nr:hypothetical protein [Chthoniobacteraceae bacterium]
MRRRAGFTLLEVCLAVAISVLLMFIAIPSFTGMLSKQKLEATFDRFDEFARQAQILSVTERRAFVIVWGDGMLAIEPDEPLAEDRGKEWPRLALSKEETLTIERPAALEKKPPMEWIFWRSGTCEPVIASYQGPEGAWVAKYDALTGRGTFEARSSL